MKKIFFFVLIISPWGWADPGCVQTAGISQEQATEECTDTTKCNCWFKTKLSKLLGDPQEIEDLYNITEILADWVDVKSDQINITDKKKLNDYFTSQIEEQIKSAYKGYNVFGHWELGSSKEPTYPLFYLKPDDKDKEFLSIYVYDKDEEQVDKYDVIISADPPCMVRNVITNEGVSMMDLYKESFKSNWESCNNKKDQLTCAIDAFTKPRENHEQK